MVTANRELLLVAIRNLHENAVRHMVEPGIIRWSMERGDDTLTVFVDDEGPGIPEDEISLVTNRFFRGRNKSPLGSGLGLSIVDLALRASGARLVLQNRSDARGLRAQIVWEIAQDGELRPSLRRYASSRLQTVRAASLASVTPCTLIATTKIATCCCLFLHWPTIPRPRSLLTSRAARCWSPTTVIKSSAICKFSRPSEASELELKSMALREKRQREGIGQQLVEAAIAYCRARNSHRLIVSTAAADIANLRFYQRQGFRMYKIVRDAFGPSTGLSGRNDRRRDTVTRPGAF